MHALSRETQNCIEACLACHATCLGTAMTHCIEMGGKHVEPQHFRLMMDCAAACQAAADFMLRKSQFHHQICALCAEICDACALSCEEVGGMEECVAACRRCAEHCREMGRKGPKH